MNIWIIDHYAVPERYYPLIRQTIFARKLTELGHTVRIFAASTVHNSDTNLIEDDRAYREEFSDGVQYTYVRCHGYRGNGVKRVLNMLEFARRLPAVCKRFAAKEGKPDAILSCSMTLQACQQGIRLARKYHAKAIAQISDLWPESVVVYQHLSPRNPAIVYLRAIEKWIYKKADALIFTMEGAYDYILEQGWEQDVPRSKVHYINNGVDLEQFDNNKTHYPVDDPDLVDPDTFKVVYAGSIRRVNNLGLLLDAAKQVKDPRVKFLIWGDGDEREALMQRGRDEQLTNVVFKGHVEKKYVPSIVSRADLNLAHNTPSPLFRFGISFNKLFDYLAAGKPVLSDFPCPYNPAVQHGAGIAVEEPTAANIAAAVERCAALPQAEYAQVCANARSAAKEYDFRALTQKLIDVIEGKA